MPTQQESINPKRSKDSKAWGASQTRKNITQRLQQVSGSGTMATTSTAAAGQGRRPDEQTMLARVDQSSSTDTIDARRKRTDTASQFQQNHRGHIPSTDLQLPRPDATADRHGSSASVQGQTIDSSDSTHTIKAGSRLASGTVSTPSYPFPRMSLHLPRGHSYLSGPRHKPFTLLSPTNVPQLSDTRPNLAEMARPHRPALSDGFQSRPSSQREEPPDDPNYPSPNLYDLVLLLHAEAGLDAWWANVTEILAEAYGVERASLAVPGDMTDLENIPWGQKATFNIMGGLDSSESSAHESAILSDYASPRADDCLHGKRASDLSRDAISRAQSQSNLKRPQLESRHSIAGVVPDTLGKELRQRPSMPVRAISGRNEKVSPRAQQACDDVASCSRAILEEDATSLGTVDPVSASASNGTRSYVHRVLQALEAEPDPLILRTGVASLLGKRHPVVMTRSFTENTPPFSQTNNSEISTGDDTGARLSQTKQTAQLPRLDTVSKLSHSYKPRGWRAYAEYEQPEPNPWSNSPHPSPAARVDPSESPFFNHSAHVDEAAFNPDSSRQDYSANQPVEAIGTDSAKTMIHIPLIQPVPSRRPMSSDLQLPTAILSLLTPITPYPLSLRHSLNDLQPHLASSYSLAQQFSLLETQVQRQSTDRYGQGLGLGGTFTDESSELELVAELSGQIARGAEEELRQFAHGSVASPSERSPISRASSQGTPFSESAITGFTPGYQTTPGRSGAEMVDSYFSSKRQRSAGTTQHSSKPLGGLGAQKYSQPGAEEIVARNKNQRHPSSSQTPSRFHGAASSRSSSIPSSPRQEDYTGDSPGRGPAHLEFPNIDFHNTGRSRSHVPTSHAATASRGLVDWPLPSSISRLLLNSVPLQLFLAKPKTGELIWTNSKFDAFRTQAQYQGSRTKDPWQNTHDDDREALVKGWFHVLKTGVQMTQHVRVKRFSDDSDYRWFIFRANPLLAPAGQLTYWIGSFLDIHDQHVAEMEAAEERDCLLRNAKYQALANSIPQILFEAVENVGIVSTNEHWHTFSGQPLEEALNLGFTKHVHRDDLEKCGIVAAIQTFDSDTSDRASSSRSSQKTVLPMTQSPPSSTDSLSLTSLVQKGIITIEQDENGRISYSTEIRLRSRRGEFRWFLVRLVKVESDLLNGGRASWYGTCTDIHDRRALEEELNGVNQRIQLEMESKTKFFANMSHEIRTPLNGILGSIPWLVESEIDPDQRRTLDTIQNSSNNLRELVDNILDVSKVEAGKMTLALKWFQIRAVVEEVIDTLASRAIDKGLLLNYALDLDVPPTVRGDPFRLRQILINLVGNAVKFTDVGEVYARCYVQEALEGQATEPNVINLAFEVIDTGRGFSESEFQRLFKQFGQTGGSSSHEAGTGLGLFLSRQLVELLGGQLTAKSEVEQGSTFSFSIRAETRPEDAPRSPATGRPISQRPSISDAAQSSSAAGRDLKNAMVTNRGIIQSPGMSRLVASPEIQSPALASSGSSNPSLQSHSGHQTDRSSMSSFLPAPEPVKLDPAGLAQSSRSSEGQAAEENSIEAAPTYGQSGSSENSQSADMEPCTVMHPTMYSVVIICSGHYARTAIKQHIEKVVPHQIAVNVTTLGSMQEFFDLINCATKTVFTHVVLDLPISHDLVLFMRWMLDFKTAVMPHLVIITDHYQKRDTMDEYAALTRAGRIAYMVQKPVKPCLFARIFDPAQQRKLSKDRNRDMAQSVSENFKNVAERVKKKLSGKGHRILLVEDSEVNRMVVLRYLKKIDVASESATNGQECLDQVMSKEPGYYSLILCDIQMPVKNGYDTCRELRDWEASRGLPALPIMALTANAMPEERAVAAKAGFTDYLTKPIEFNKLGTMMATLLDPRTKPTLLRDRQDRDVN